MHTFASANVTTGEVTRRLYGSRTQKRRKDGLCKTKRMQVAFAHHLIDVARAYPSDEHPKVVLVIDNVPWHRGRPVDWALGRYPHLTLHRLPPYSPQMQPIERLWCSLCQRSTHNILFDELHKLQHALRAGLLPRPAPGSAQSVRLSLEPDSISRGVNKRDVALTAPAHELARRGSGRLRISRLCPGPLRWLGCLPSRNLGVCQSPRVAVDCTQVVRELMLA